jgi:hypothetical protein
MKALINRLCRLEQRFLPEQDSEWAIRLRQRIEAGRNRLSGAETNGRYRRPMWWSEELQRSGPETIGDALDAGRLRVASAK